MKKTRSAAYALYNKDGLYCLIWILIQQIVVASSTYFIIKLSESVSTAGSVLSYKYLLLFSASLILVYLPISLSHLYVDKFHLTSYRKYIQLFEKNNSGKVNLSHKRIRTKYEAWLTNESIVVFEKATHLIYDASATFLNAFLNILVIGFTLSASLIGWYLLAGVVLLSSIIIFNKRLIDVSLDLQEQRKNLSSLMLKAWSNITSNNRHNRMIWDNSFSDLFEKTKAAIVRYNITKAAISSFTVILAISFVGYGVFSFLNINSDNIVLISAMVVSLPRQVQIIQSIFAFFSNALQMQGIRKQLQGLDKPLNIKEPCVLKFIRFEQLKFHIDGIETKFPTIKNCEETLVGLLKGRVTIRGKNGSGKSTFLSNLSQKLGSQVFFLPTEQDFLFKDKAIFEVSDGERIVRILDELSIFDMPRILILDEWDANLDSSNIVLLNSVIDNLAKRCVVIESRHRNMVG